MPKIALFFKAHVETYTRKDGAVVAAHDDKRPAARAPIKKGDRVRIKPEHQDDGDDKYTWHAIDDEEKGRVTVSPTDHPMRIKPTYVMHSHMVEHHDDGKSKASSAKDWRDEENWHARAMGRMKTLGENELRFIIKDAREAAKHAWDMGNKAKAGQYEDEAHYAAMELEKRTKPVREAKAKHDAERQAR